MRLMIRTWLMFILASSGSLQAADDLVQFDFETVDYGSGWTIDGDAFGTGPARGGLKGQMTVSGYTGSGLINTFLDGDRSTGSLLSPSFLIERDHLAFQIGGGRQPDQLRVELLLEGDVIHSETGSDSETLRWQSWDVREYAGRTVQLRVTDTATGGWGHLLLDQVTQTNTSRRVIEVGRLSSYRRSSEYYREPYRPQFHFTPEMNWMNDPNGMVFHNGEYHLHYQFNPHGNEWGHMSWGHAVSKDLVHWTHLPISLHDELGVMVFSGSAVVDHRNTSGFGLNERPPLIAIYTGHSPGLQTQDIAYSNDDGRTWIKYPGNPVIDLGEADFRDPKVFWHQPTSKWVMVVSLAVQKKLQFYGSGDLKTWTLLSEFGPAGVKDKPNWECPDLFELPVENEPGQKRWVLEADMGGGAVAGGSGGEYFVGTFDGMRFVPDSTESQWVDFGRDFYAPVSWSDIPETDGRRIWIGWMNNWETCLNPTSPWRSAMSVPRELTLRRIDGSLRLCQRPVRELQTLRTDAVRLENLSVRQDPVPLPLQGQQLELILELLPGQTTECGIRLLKGTAEETIVGYDRVRKQVFVDRRRSGNVSFHPAFAGRHAGPLSPNSDGSVRLHILVDSCSVEVFGNHGETVITDLVFPSASSVQAEFFAVDGEMVVRSCDGYRMKSIWPTPSEQ